MFDSNRRIPPPDNTFRKDKRPPKREWDQQRGEYRDDSYSNPSNEDSNIGSPTGTPTSKRRKYSNPESPNHTPDKNHQSSSPFGSPRYGRGYGSYYGSSGNDSQMYRYQRDQHRSIMSPHRGYPPSFVPPPYHYSSQDRYSSPSQSPHGPSQPSFDFDRSPSGKYYRRYNDREVSPHPRKRDERRYSPKETVTPPPPPTTSSEEPTQHETQHHVEQKKEHTDGPAAKENDKESPKEVPTSPKNDASNITKEDVDEKLVHQAPEEPQEEPLSSQAVFAHKQHLKSSLKIIPPENHEDNKAEKISTKDEQQPASATSMTTPESSNKRRRGWGWGVGLASIEKKKTPATDDNVSPTSTTSNSALDANSQLENVTATESQVESSNQELSQQLTQNQIVDNDALDAPSPTSALSTQNLTADLPAPDTTTTIAPMLQPPMQEEPPLPSQEEILTAMEKVDNNITKIQMELESFKSNSQNKLARAQSSRSIAGSRTPPPNKPDGNSNEESATSHSTAPVKHRTKIQQIYLENRERSKQSENVFEMLCNPLLECPLKNHTTFDHLELIKNNQITFEAIKDELTQIIANTVHQSHIKLVSEGDRYKKMKQDWKQVIISRGDDNDDEGKDPMAEPPPDLDTLTPEERLQWDEDEEDRLQAEEENRRRIMKSLAKCPDMLTRDDKYCAYDDQNGYVDSQTCFMEYKLRRSVETSWTPHEKETFYKIFAQFPKDLRRVKQHLPNKSMPDLVNFYYNNKMSKDFKALMSEVKQKRRYKRRIIEEGGTNHRSNGRVSITSGGRKDLESNHDSSHQSNHQQHSQEDDLDEDEDDPDDPDDDVMLNQDVDHEALTRLEKSLIRQALDNGEPIEISREMRSLGLTAENIHTVSGTRTSRGRSNSHLERPSNANKQRRDSSEEVYIPMSQPGSVWTQQEKDLFIDLFAQYGRNFATISAKMKSRTPQQCQKFYTIHKKKLDVDLPVDQRKPGAKPKNKKQEVPPSCNNQSINASSSHNNAATPTQSSSSSSNAAALKKKKNSTSPNGSPLPTNLNSEKKKQDGQQSNNPPKKVTVWITSEKDAFLEHFQECGRDWKKIAELIPTKTELQIKSFFQNYKVKLGLAPPASKKLERRMKKKQRKRSMMHTAMQLIASAGDVARESSNDQNDLCGLALLAQEIADKQHLTMDEEASNSAGAGDEVKRKLPKTSGYQYQSGNSMTTPPPPPPSLSQLMSSNHNLRKPSVMNSPALGSLMSIAAAVANNTTATPTTNTTATSNNNNIALKKSTPTAFNVDLLAQTALSERSSSNPPPTSLPSLQDIFISNNRAQQQQQQQQQQAPTQPSQEEEKSTTAVLNPAPFGRYSNLYTIPNMPTFNNTNTVPPPPARAPPPQKQQQQQQQQQPNTISNNKQSKDGAVDNVTNPNSPWYIQKTFTPNITPNQLSHADASSSSSNNSSNRQSALDKPTNANTTATPSNLQSSSTSSSTTSQPQQRFNNNPSINTTNNTNATNNNSPQPSPSNKDNNNKKNNRSIDLISNEVLDRSVNFVAPPPGPTSTLNKNQQGNSSNLPPFATFSTVLSQLPAMPSTGGNGYVQSQQQKSTKPFAVQPPHNSRQQQLGAKNNQQQQQQPTLLDIQQQQQQQQIVHQPLQQSQMMIPPHQPLQQSSSSSTSTPSSSSNNNLQQQSILQSLQSQQHQLHHAQLLSQVQQAPPLASNTSNSSSSSASSNPSKVSIEELEEGKIPDFLGSKPAWNNTQKNGQPMFLSPTSVHPTFQQTLSMFKNSGLHHGNTTNQQQPFPFGAGENLLLGIFNNNFQDAYKRVESGKNENSSVNNAQQDQQQDGSSNT